VIRDSLSGRRIAVTGGTGFLGTALIERLLRSVPGCEVAALVRPGRRASASERTRREILRNDCFDRLRSEKGDRFDAEIAARLITIAGDVGVDGLGLDDDGRALLASCDVVVHSAATVSFDAPLDGAVEVNLLGPSRVATAIQQVAGSASLPHLIAVSTAYVNSGHRGDAFEELLTASRYAVDVDWRGEVLAARRARADADAESRRPDMLTRFRKAARRELGAAGTALLAERTENLRGDWVKDHMVELGRARAQALGWPDAYAYTKSLGERALLESRGQLPVSIVRPSIVESALAEPRKGWIRGFRMAEPVIISSARGLLREFPGVPEGVVDVIPVDLVVATIIAVAGVGGSPGEPSVYQVASGARNPLRYGEMVSIIRGWFAENPLYDSRGQPILVPEWSFPGRGRVQGQLRRATVALSAAERVANALPIRGQWADRASRIEERRVEAERALDYVELYGAYIESEARFRMDRTLALAASLDAADRAEFQIDPAVIDWSHYLRDVHVPSVVEHARVRTDPGRRSGESRADRLRRGVLTAEPRCAVFDLENTLIASNVVESYAWLATRHCDLPERARVVAGLLAEAPRLLALDRRDRADFLRYFYRRYEGAPAERTREDSYELFDDLILTRAFPAGIARVRRHRELGHPTLLITGALDFVIEPLRPLFDEVICASLGESYGALTGQLTATPPTGEARTIVMDEWARSRGLTLEQTVSYADSTSDLPMLEAAGHPVAVNPEAKLATIARRRGWLIENWQRARGGPRKPLAISTRTRGIRSPLGPPASEAVADADARTSLATSSRNGALR
jgi:HAD superfamily phosphoserine phosphatase-like hydrolase